MPSLVKTASNMLVNFESRSRIRELELRNKVVEVHEQVAGLLGDPVRGGMCGDAEDAHPAVGVLNDREAVQPGEEHGVAMEKVAGENSVCLATQKFGPGGTRASWGRIYTGALENRPDGGGADLPAHAGKFSGDASVAPAWVLGRHAHNHPAQ